MTDKEINISMMGNRPYNARQEPHVKTLATMLELAFLDANGGKANRFSMERRNLIKKLPVTLGCLKIDDFLHGEPNPTVYQAAELLLTEGMEGTNLVQTEMLRTVIAGAEKFKVFREAGVAWYTPKGNALDVPLGEAQTNAPVIPEGTEIKGRTQDYGKRTFSIVKYGVKPQITYEMIEDGMIDAAAEEIFYAGASLENKLNYDGLTALATNANNTTTNNTAGTAGNGLIALKQAKKLLKQDGFFADTLLMCSDLESDLLSNASFTTPYGGMGENVIRQGSLPSPLYGMRWFVTDNGSTAVDGSNPWAYDSASDVGGIVMEAKRGCGIAMRRDRTIKRFDDITHELDTITATMRCDINYLHANAVCKVNYLTA